MFLNKLFNEFFTFRSRSEVTTIWRYTNVYIIIIIIYFTPIRGVKYCNQQCVCMSVCSHISKTTCPNFTEFSVHITCGHGLLRRQCSVLCTGFVFKLIFSHNGMNWPESKTTRMFRPVCNLAPLGQSPIFNGMFTYIFFRKFINMTNNDSDKQFLCQVGCGFIIDKSPIP